MSGLFLSVHFLFCFVLVIRLDLSWNYLKKENLGYVSNTVYVWLKTSYMINAVHFEELY